jgi:hypothetical protein
MLRASFNVNIWRKICGAAFCFCLLVELVFHAEHYGYGHFSSSAEQMMTQSQLAILGSIVPALSALLFVDSLTAKSFVASALPLIGRESESEGHQPVHNG